MERAIEKHLFVFVFIFILFTFACQIGSAQDKHLEATFCAESQSSGMSLFLIFDLNNKGILCDKPVATIVLKKPSVSVNPKTVLYDGNFIIRGEDNDDTEYGHYQYTNVNVKGTEWTVSAFFRQGYGEKQIGFASQDGGIYVFGNKKQIKIGESQYMNLKMPDGGTWTRRVHRLSIGSGPWIVSDEDKIYRVEKSGNLTQVGWVAWRKIKTPEGRTLTILMTKGMGEKGENVVWAGRFDGKLYKDGKP